MPRGVILIYLVLILGSAGLAATAMLARSGINLLVDANDGVSAMTTRAEAFGCLDEVLIHLQKDNAYAPATLTTGYATCQLSVTTPGSGLRTTTVTLTDGSITRRVYAEITLSPFTVTQIIEQ